MGLRELTFGDERPLQEIADSLAGSHKILVVTGAGISTSCGIPDFRSKDGLYNIIPEQALLPTPPASQPSTPSRNHVDVEDHDIPSSQSSSSSNSSRRASASPSSKIKGQDLFDSRVFQNAASTTLFYQFIASLRQKIRDEVRSTSSVHKLIRVLRDGGRLMRCYTQNIDGLEAREGLVTDLARGRGNKRRFMKKHYEVPLPAHTSGTDFDGGCEVVQLHGDLDKLRCSMCATHFEWTDEETEIYLDGAAPSCQKCKSKSEERQASGKRGLAVGSLRPNIVLYGEDHPSNTLLTPLIPFDANCQPEVMIIMGTSLKVFGLQKIVREFAKAIHSRKNGKGRVIFINRTRPAETTWDGIIDDFVAMDCDDWVTDLKTRRPDLWLRQGDLALTVTKSGQPKRKRKSVELDEGVENMPYKRSKITVDIPAHARFVQQTPPSTPSRKQLPMKYKLPPNYPGRAVLSPLAQARRPSVSPLSSPVRMADDEGRSTPAKRSTPKRPAFSPFSPGVLSGSRLKIEVFCDDNQEENFVGDGVEDSDDDLELDETSLGNDEENKSRARPAITLPQSHFMARVWQRFPGRRILPYSNRFKRSEGSLDDDEEEDDVITVETPSRGPRGRKIDVLEA
ncbi:NAD-dependent deacetylase hst3 [Exophiala xenobiotica]|nr:NAD-dependent deacetylase hst3 [Exophiala xenobiotica]